VGKIGQKKDVSGIPCYGSPRYQGYKSTGEILMEATVRLTGYRNVKVNMIK